MNFLEFDKFSGCYNEERKEYNALGFEAPIFTSSDESSISWSAVRDSTSLKSKLGLFWNIFMLFGALSSGPSKVKEWILHIEARGMNNNNL
jgi:hypothetical protein